MSLSLIHAGTVTHEGKPRHYYTDDRDALPAYVSAYRAFWYDPTMTPWPRILEAIRQTEANGDEICWQVGNQYYETGVGLVREG